jgi:sigma-B regulation protein RsbU (phosphoserine phosphatase)
VTVTHPPEDPTRQDDFRDLTARVEEVIRTLDRTNAESPTVDRIASAVTAALGEEMGLSGGRIYQRDEDDGYWLWTTFGSAKPVARGTHIHAGYTPIQQLHAQGSLYAEADDPGLDPEIEALVGANDFAALMVGDHDEYLIAFDLTPDHRRDPVLFSLGLLRHSINNKIGQERVKDVLREARRIQQSILPARAPSFGRFDLFGRSESMETVGGDFFDYIPISEKILGLAIADVSGHGLPAALQVRDIYMGLRMGLSRDFKIVRTVERLNQIINQSTLTGRFVSMFYGELEVDGTFIYVNAGHPAPFHLTAGGELTFLDQGGVVLGPLPNASYTRGYCSVRPGDLLVFYTDGIVEAQREGVTQLDEYGVDRLVACVRPLAGGSAEEIGEGILRDVDRFSGGDSPGDDRTVLVVKLPEDA